MAKALITGVTGQDGSTWRSCCSQGYEVHGIKRRSSMFNTSRIDHLFRDPHEDGLPFLHHGDDGFLASLLHIIQRVQPDEIYNLAAQSHVAVSFRRAWSTRPTRMPWALRILEAIRSLNLTNKTRFYQASASELYGLVCKDPQRETTPFYPSRSPFNAVAKLYAYWIGELPQGLRHLRLQRHLVQPRGRRARPSSPADHARWPASSWACRTASTWAT